MAERYMSPDELQFQHDLEMLERKQEAEAQERADKLKYAHELDLAKLKYATQPRHKAVARVCLAAIKMLAVPVVVLCIAVLAARDKPIPTTLTSYLDL